MQVLADRLTATSATFPANRLREILRDARPFMPDAHVLYPADEKGQHLRGFFAIEPVAADETFVKWIREDLVAWLEREGIEFDVLFAPAQPAVRILGDAVAEAVGRPAAYWEHLPSGRFGSHLVAGHVDAGAHALVFNGVSHTGRCVGERLPAFVEGLGGRTVAAAAVVKGTVPKVRETERRMGNRFYSALQADVPLYSPSECPICKATGERPVPWTELTGDRRS